MKNMTFKKITSQRLFLPIFCLALVLLVNIVKMCIRDRSFVEYLTQVRMERACELLKCTSYRTSEIGEQVGYNDSHYFSSAFKKAMGQSPKEYKASQTRQE